MRVGFVGAGRMGMPMVLKLQERGHRISLLCRTDAAAQSARRQGVTPAHDLAQTCADADVIIVCVFSDDQVADVCLGAGGVVESAASGATIVIHTTGSPLTAVAVAQAATSRDVLVLDAPVSGGPHDVAAGAITLFVGGDAAALDAARPALSAYGSPIVHAGPVGFGQRIKLVNNALFSAALGLSADAMRLGGELGLSDGVLIEGLTAGSSGRPAIALIAATGSVERLAATVGEFVGKDVRAVRTAADTLGADLGILGEVLSSAYVRRWVLAEQD